YMSTHTLTPRQPSRNTPPNLRIRHWYLVFFDAASAIALFATYARGIMNVLGGALVAETIAYIHLAPREGSAYQQYFVRGRNLRAETLYRAIVGPEPMTPDEVARDYDVPLEAVREA